MNKYYFIVPTVLLVGFIFVYRGAVNDMEVKEARIKAAVEAKKVEEDAHRKEIEAKAQEDAIKRQQENEAAERAKVEKKEKKYQDDMALLKKETDGYNAECDRYTKDSAELDRKLADARQLKERTTREVFDLAKQVELAKVSRRNAEIEVQRMVEMVGQKAVVLAYMPPVAPPPK